MSGSRPRPTRSTWLAAEAAVASAEASVESAQAALASAQAAYSDLQAGASEDQKRAAAATLERARIVRDQAQSAYDQIAGQPNVGMMPQSLQLQQATIDYETAAANYRVSTAAGHGRPARRFPRADCPGQGRCGPG